MNAASALQPAASPLAPTPTPPTLDMTNKTESVEVSATKPAPTPDDKPAKFTEEGYEQKYDDTIKDIAAINEKTGAMQPPEYKMPKYDPPKQTDPVKAWGSVAMAMAAVGSLLTRTPMTTALNAAAGVMKAYKENDKEAEESYFKQWKEATELAYKQQQFQNEAYKTVLQNAQKSETEKLAALNAYGSAFGHVAMVDAAKTRNLHQAEKLAQDGEKLNDQMYANMPKIIEGKMLHDAMRDPEFKAKLAAAKTPEEKAEITAALMEKVAPDMAQTHGVYSDDTLRSMAEQAWAGDTSVFQNMGRGKSGDAAKVRLRNMITNIGKEQGKTDKEIGRELAVANAEFQGLKAGERTLDQRAVQIGMGAAEIQTFSPLVSEASAALKRTKYPTINAALNAFKKQSGDTQLRDLNLKVQAFQNAMATVISRGGPGTDAVRSLSHDLMNSDDPDQVIQAALKAAAQEVRAAQAAPGIVRDELRRGVDGKDTGSNRGPAQATLHGKPIWPNGTHWVYEDGSEAK